MGALAEDAINDRSAHGRRMGKLVGVEDPPTLRVRVIQKSVLAVTHLSCDRLEHPVTASVPREDAYVVSLQRGNLPSVLCWADGREYRFAPRRRGQFTILDLNRGVGAHLHSAFNNLHVHIPRSLLNAITDEVDAPRVESLATPTGVAVDDPTIRHIGGILLSAVEAPERTDRLFLDYIAMAFHLHLVTTYGQARPRQAPWRGGLSSSQERRVKEMLLARLSGDISLDELAAACGLSRSHFARAFRTSVGQPPHRWLLARRVDRARDLLLLSGLSLAEIAVASGFANQSHFTAVFTRSVGASPGAWRRSRRT
jgi:AraC family transcriptional regulator